MNKTFNLKNIILAAAVSFLLSLSAYSLVHIPSAGAQNIKNNLCSGSSFDLSGSGADCGGASAANARRSLNNVITLIVNVLSIIVGIVAVIMIIVGGLKYITSAGDANKIASAKTTIIYALVGLIIVALAQFVVRFILSRIPTS